MQDPVSHLASSKPLRRRETAQPVDSKQLVGRGQQRTSPRFRLQHPQIFPRGHWVRAQHFTSGPCKSHEANQSTPYCRQRLPHQIIWHPPNPTSTGATEIFLAIYCRRSHSTHHRRRFSPIAQPASRSRQRTPHSHRQFENNQRFQVSSWFAANRFTCLVGQVHVHTSETSWADNSYFLVFATKARSSTSYPYYWLPSSFPSKTPLSRKIQGIKGRVQHTCQTGNRTTFEQPILLAAARCP